MRVLARFLWVFVAALVLATAPSAAMADSAGTVTEFPVSGMFGSPYDIAAGPDGNLWFTEDSAIGRMTTAGRVTHFPLRGTTHVATSITAGPDGSLWFTMRGPNAIGRITTAGLLTEFPLGAAPERITTGPDGNLWFTEGQANKIGRMTTLGVVTEFPLPSPDSQPYAITAGSDGNLWFTEVQASKIGRISTAGAITEFPVASLYGWLQGITAGSDGNLWFTDRGDLKIGRITPSGMVHEYMAIEWFDGGPTQIALGPDGNLWFTMGDWGGRIARFTASGIETDFDVPVINLKHNTQGITAGPDGNLWFTDRDTNSIGRITAGANAGKASLDLRQPGAYAEVAHTPELNLTGDWTVESWFKDESPLGYNHDFASIVSKGDLQLDGEAPYMLVLGYKSLRAGLRTGYRNHVVSYDLHANHVTTNAWHHVAATFQSSTTTLTLYVDGFQVAREVLGARSTGNALPLSIGREGKAGKYWTGKIDDVRVWNRLRTAGEIGATYQAQLAGPLPNLVGNWKFDEARGSGSASTDNATPPHPATLVHGADLTCDMHLLPACTP